MAWRKLKLRWAAACVGCGSALPVGADAWWNTTTREVTCPACRAGGLHLDRGQPGASVGREYLRRRHNRETRTLQAHPRIGPLLLALRSAPRHEKAFRAGELGEIAVAASLERDVAWPAIVLHDRRMPGRYGNIDHLAIAPAGVWIIDAKGSRGKVKVHTPLLGPPRLLIDGRDRTKLLDGLDRQVRAVPPTSTVTVDRRPGRWGSPSIAGGPAATISRRPGG